MPDSHLVTVAQRKQLACDVYELTIQFIKKPIINFRPGHFIKVYLWIDSLILCRSYTLSCIGEYSDNVTFIFSYSPKKIASRHLRNIKIGEMLTITGPHGSDVFPWAEASRYVLIGTGTGIALYRAMLPELEKKLLLNPNLKVTLLLGAKNRDHIPYLEDFLTFFSKVGFIDIILKYSLDVTCKLDFFESMGRIQTAIGNLNLNYEQDIVFLSGHPDMTSDVTKQLEKFGFEDFKKTEVDGFCAFRRQSFENII